MTDVRRQLSVDEAMASFARTAMTILESLPNEPVRDRAPPTFAEAEAERFHLAEKMLAIACPAPAGCTHHRCRRNRLCQHFDKLRAFRHPPDAQPPSRRSPGARAMRYAVWVYMNNNFA